MCSVAAGQWHSWRACPVKAKPSSEAAHPASRGVHSIDRVFPVIGQEAAAIYYELAARRLGERRARI